MKRLAYGILRDRETPPLPELAARGGPALGRVVFDGLAIAFSSVPDEAVVPDLARLRAYADVVASLHRHATVLPLRYGCLPDSDSELEALLRRNHRAWSAALNQVEHCDELGLRIRLDPSGSAIRPVPLVGSTAPVSPGIAYLAARRTRYAAGDALRGNADAAAERMRNAFTGLFRQCRIAKTAAAEPFWLSLAFLVPREHREPFHRGFAASGDSLGTDDPDRPVGPLSLRRAPEPAIAGSASA